MARGGRHLRHLGPSAWYAMQQNEKRNRATREVDQQLGHVGPDNRFHAALEGVKHGQGDDQHHRGTLRSPQHHADHQRNRRDAHALREHPGYQKRARCDGAHTRAESLFDQRVRGDAFAAKVAGKQQHDDQRAPHHVPEDELQKGEVPDVGNRRCADDGQRRSLGRNDGKCERPPGRCPSAQEVVASALLSAAKPNAQRCNAEQIHHHDRRVRRMYAHVRSDYM